MFNTGASLTIEKCVVRNLTFSGIWFRPNASSSLAVSDTLAANNGAIGINVGPSGSGAVTAVLTRVEADNNSTDGILVYGISSTGMINTTATDSVAVFLEANGVVLRGT